MLVATALAMALLGHPHAKVAPSTRRYAAGVWTLTVHSDGFTGATTCSVRSSRIVIRRDTAIFELDPNKNTDHAQFRIDGGAARSVQDVTLENARHGVFPDRGWIDNPSGGEIAVPVTDIANAKRIWIRVWRHGRVVSFNVNHLGEVLRSAAGLGCPATAL